MHDSSILAGVAKLIDKALRLENGWKYHEKRTWRSLSKEHPDFEVKAPIRKILCQIELNWSQEESRSDENWRWKPNPQPKRTESEEVKLERWIVRTKGGDWVNQVPVASGLTRIASGRRAIDLVHRCGKGCYEFIELKIGADNPLFAAMEILQYGVLYIFSRENAVELGYDEKKKEILQANCIHLKVLAPDAYYRGYDLTWVKKCINTGLTEFMARGNRGFTMDFKFDTLESIGFPCKVGADSPREMFQE